MNLSSKLLLFGGQWAACIMFLHAPVSRSNVPVRLHFRHVFGQSPLELYDVRFHTKARNILSVTRLSYLISDVQLTSEDGSVAEFPNQVFWMDAESGRTDGLLQDVPIGRYRSLSFKVGIGSKLNHSDPAKFAADHPLNPSVSHLHWGWQGGYVFLAIEGRYEQPGSALGGYSYHIGTDARLMTVRLNRAFEIKGSSRLDLALNLASIFDGSQPIQISGRNSADSTHSAANDPLAAKTAANIEGAFNFEGCHPDDYVDEKHEQVARPVGTTQYTFQKPPHFPEPSLPFDNPLTVEGVELGRQLFFEKLLSGNNSQSCSTCHQPTSAYADAGKSLSRGIDGKVGRRNSMSLMNLAWNSTLTWDGRRARIRDQVLAPIQDEKEMHQSLPATIKKLESSPTYPELFAKAFGSNGVTSERIGLAIEQYLLTLISADSKFDRALRREETFTDEEKQGFFLFITEYSPAREQFGADCFHCHGGNLFSDFYFRNNGLLERGSDLGRQAVTGMEYDRNKFKTPSLRNVEVTGPYMHDGRFKTLEEVVAHYDHGIHDSSTLDPNIAKHPRDGIHLSKKDQKALVAFLKTLTDYRFKPADPPSLGRSRQ